MNDTPCKICGKSKTASEKGSLTQFIATCNCVPDLDQRDSLKEIEIKLCKVCGKRIGQGREGSLTQFIFRADICDCTKPQPISEFVRTRDESIKYDELIIEDEPELELDKESFPVGRYKPVKKLGEGGVGAVYLARDRLLNKLVAVKTLHVLNIKELITFQKEALATSKMTHPNIIEILDFGSTEYGTPYMVLEYFESKTLSALISEHGQLDWKLVKPAIEQIASALSYSHEQGIFHRDVKPSNILIKELQDDSVQVKLIDFGIAGVTEATGTTIQGKTLIGTPAYMSPDAFFGKSFSASSEVYSLGAVIFNALTGQVPFEAETSMKLLNMHAKEAPPSMAEVSETNIPEDAENIVSVCLKKDASQRFQSMENFIQALNRSYTSQEAAYSTTTDKRSGVLKPAIVLLCILGVLAAGLLFYFQKEDKTEIARNSESYSFAIEFEERKHDYNYIVVKKWLKPIATRRKVNDYDLKTIADMLKGKNSIALDLSGSDITGKGFQYMKGLPIEFLTLEDSKINERFFHFLDLPILKCLVIDKTTVSDKGLQKIGSFDNIKVLHASGCKNFSDSAINNLLANSNISHISLINTPIGDPAFSNLSRTKIQHLCLGKTRITDKGLKDLAKVKILKAIEVNDCKRVSLDGIKNICEQNPALEIISMAYINFDNGSISSLKNCRNLHFLNIMGAPVNDDDLRVLAKLNRLDTLYISNALITDKGLRHLSRLPLANVSLSNCKYITSTGIEALRKKLHKNAYIFTDKDINSTFGINKEFVKPFYEASD